MEVVVSRTLSFDLFVNVLPLLSVKWRYCSKHLVEHAAETPPVTLFAVAGPEDDFRSEILGCAAEGLALAIIDNVVLAETEISQFCKPITVDQNVLRFKTES